MIGAGMLKAWSRGSSFCGGRVVRRRSGRSPIFARRCARRASIRRRSSCARSISNEQAELERFPGSPTIRINGNDPFPGDQAIGLSCRIYRTADGRPSPTPDPQELKTAIARLVAA